MFSNPRGARVAHWTIVFGVIDSLAVLLRFVVRKKSGTKIGADDWMILASLVPAYSMIVSANLCESALFEARIDYNRLFSWTNSGISKGGAGKHQVDMTDLEMTLLLKVTREFSLIPPKS